MFGTWVTWLKAWFFIFYYIILVKNILIYDSLSNILPEAICKWMGQKSSNSWLLFFLRRELHWYFQFRGEFSFYKHKRKIVLGGLQVDSSPLALFQSRFLIILNISLVSNLISESDLQFTVVHSFNHWYQQCVTVHNMLKCKIYIGRVHCLSFWLYICIYIIYVIHVFFI